MDSHHASVADASILTAFTLRTLETVPANKSMPTPVRCGWNTTDLASKRNFKQLFDQMRAMQDHITQLSASIRSMAGSEHSPAGISATGTYQLSTQRSLRHLSSAKEASFQGPTTSAFSFDLAKSSLQQRGIVERAEAGDEGDMTREPSPLASPSAPNEELGTRQTLDPLWMIPKAEALRLCRVYEEEMGIMYPILELSELLDQVHLLYNPMDRALGQIRQSHGHNELVQEDVHILRVVFACALTAEASGRSEQAIALFDSVREVQDNCVWGAPDIKNIIFLTLVVRHAQPTMNVRHANFNSRCSIFKWTRKSWRGAPLVSLSACVSRKVFTDGRL